MTLRAGRCAFTLGFAALCGIGGSALPAAAQSYLADNGSNNVTVDYSVIGAGPGPVTRGALPGSALPAGSCSCADAPMGVIATPPRPTFTNPFNAQVTQAPAVPPGFMAYSQIAGSSGGSSAVVLREPSAPTQMASSEAAPVEEAPAEPLPATTETQSSAEAEPALPATTQTQSESSKAADQAAASTGESTPPAQPETMPTEVPSPVEQPAAQAPAAPAPTTPAETQTAEATPETPAASSAATSATTGTEAQPEGEQQAAVAPETPPAAPAEGTTPPAAEAAGALPAGAVRIVYASDAGEIPADSSAQLDTIAQDLLANQDKRIQVLSYAAGSADNENKARRKSLERGLAIRSYLMKAGVPSTRIDVRALGNKSEGGPADRVDIIPAS